MPTNRPHVSILSSLPQTCQDVAVAREDPERDYVYANLRGYSRSADEIWAAVGETMRNVSDYLDRLAELNNVEVIHHAGLDELKAAAHKSDIVAVLAHWKGPRAVSVPSDLRSDPCELSEQLRRCVEMLILPEQVLSEDLDKLHPQKAKDVCIHWLNEAIQVRHDWIPFEQLLGPGIDAAAVSNAYLYSWARTTIDDVFTREHLLPGVCLDLASGLATPSDIAGCFPNGWAGICDFVCCTSEYLAEETKSRHPAALFRADSRLLHPTTAIKALTAIIPRLDHTDPDRLASSYLEFAHEYDHSHEKR